MKSAMHARNRWFSFDPDGLGSHANLQKETLFCPSGVRPG